MALAYAQLMAMCLLVLKLTRVPLVPTPACVTVPLLSATGVAAIAATTATDSQDLSGFIPPPLLNGALVVWRPPAKPQAHLPPLSYCAQNATFVSCRLCAGRKVSGRRRQAETRSHTKIRVSPGAIALPAPR